MRSRKVTVLMPVYNAERFVTEAIESILAQSFSDFEFLIINDGSTDSSKKIIDRFANANKRIIAINQSNSGIVKALNKGIKSASGEYIARMDADDISEPDRLKLQIDYLEKNKNCVVVGSSFVSISEDGRNFGQHYCFINNTTIRHALPLEGCIPHPTAIYRRQSILDVGGYRASYFPSEDYDLWRRLSKKGELHNIEVPLLRYRISDSGISSKNQISQRAAARRIRDEEWAESTDEELKVKIKALLLPGEHKPAIIDLQKRLCREALRRKRFGLYSFLKIDIVKYHIKNEG